LSTSGRVAGRFVRQPQGYRAFIPEPLPPEPGVVFDADLVNLLGMATTAVGRLDGVARMLPNPDLFVAMYVRREAVLSSQIEGTQSTLDDVLTYELGTRADGVPEDVAEVVNYVRAMNYGLRRLADLPLSLRLLREIHGMLLEGVRGSTKTPGEFRTTQNWIGPAGPRGLDDAAYVPPPPHQMRAALDNFEKFLWHSAPLHPLLACGLAHAQFETIHPFLDGNGRVGRLLITFMLCHDGVLRSPLLYLSHYLKQHRAEYYDRLTAIRTNGDWEGWLRFFLTGVRVVAEEAEDTAGRIVDLREEVRLDAQEAGVPGTGLNLVDQLFERPIINVSLARDLLGVTFAAANGMVRRLQDVGILTEVTGSRRNRLYKFDRYLALFDSSAPADAVA
jgi:Fic family protein